MSNTAKNFKIPATNSNVLHNYFYSLTKLFFWSVSSKILDPQQNRFFVYKHDKNSFAENLATYRSENNFVKSSK